MHIQPREGGLPEVCQRDEGSLAASSHADALDGGGVQQLGQARAQLPGGGGG